MRCLSCSFSALIRVWIYFGTWINSFLTGDLRPLCGISSATSQNIRGHPTDYLRSPHGLSSVTARIIFGHRTNYLRSPHGLSASDRAGIRGYPHGTNTEFCRKSEVFRVTYCTFKSVWIIISVVTMQIIRNGHMNYLRRLCG